MDPEEADFPSIWTLAKGAGVGLGWAVFSTSGPLSPPHNGVTLLMRARGGISLERGSPHPLLKEGVSSRHMTQMFPLPPSWFMSFQSMIGSLENSEHTVSPQTPWLSLVSLRLSSPPTSQAEMMANSSWATLFMATE